MIVIICKYVLDVNMLDQVGVGRKVCFVGVKFFILVGCWQFDLFCQIEFLFIFVIEMCGFGNFEIEVVKV